MGVALLVIGFLCQVGWASISAHFTCYCHRVKHELALDNARRSNDWYYSAGPAYFYPTIRARFSWSAQPITERRFDGIDYLCLKQFSCQQLCTPARWDLWCQSWAYWFGAGQYGGRLFSKFYGRWRFFTYCNECWLRCQNTGRKFSDDTGHDCSVNRFWQFISTSALCSTGRDHHGIDCRSHWYGDFKVSMATRPLRCGQFSGCIYRCADIWVKYWLGHRFDGVLCQPNLAIKQTTCRRRWSASGHRTLSQHQSSWCGDL